MPNLRSLPALALCLTSVIFVPAVSIAGPDDKATTQLATHIGSMPSRGMTMDQVIQYFGQPTQRYAAVGNPPISRWQYDGLIVYFEYKYVIGAVATDDNQK